MQTILITGGTGLVGSQLTKQLTDKGYKVIILTRKKPATTNPSSNIDYALWNVQAQTIDSTAIASADYIIHLAGAGVVDKKWTDAYKQEIIDSRTKSSELLVKALATNQHKVKAVVSTSAIGWYGPDTAKNQPSGFTEDYPSNTDFLGTTCKLWEESIQPVTQQNIRLTTLRLGIVLSNNGGAFVEFKKTLRAGIASILGSGNQQISWIHIDDLCRIFIEAMENNSFSGVYNAVAPKPVSNKAFMMTLGKKMRGKFFIPMPVPSFVLKIMLGERSIEVLKSCTVSCAKLKQTGFTFIYPTVEAAFQNLCSKASRR